MQNNAPSSNGSGMYVIRPRWALKTQVTWKSGPKAHGPHSSYTDFSLPACMYCFMGEFPTINWQEEKTWAWFTDGSAWYADTTWNWTAAALWPLSGTSLNDIGEGKSLVGRTSGSTSDCSLMLERQMTRCVIIYQFLGYIPVPGLWPRVRDLERAWLKNWWQI